MIEYNSYSVLLESRDWTQIPPFVASKNLYLENITLIMLHR